MLDFDKYECYNLSHVTVQLAPVSPIYVYAVTDIQS